MEPGFTGGMLLWCPSYTCAANPRHVAHASLEIRLPIHEVFQVISNTSHVDVCVYVGRC